MTNEIRPKKINVSWKRITLEAIIALSGGNNSVDVSTQEIYQWIESTEYLTEWGRNSDPNWTGGVYPSYRASLQHEWQKLVNKNIIISNQRGSYRLVQEALLPKKSQWEKMLEIDEQLSNPVVRRSEMRRISRSQKLRDELVNYYDSHCQICEDDAPFRIPTEIPNRFHVEVHHVKGLAESYALKQEGLLIGLRVNGLCNLTVLCPHHHGVVHHHWPNYVFDRQALLWRNERGKYTAPASSHR